MAVIHVRTVGDVAALIEAIGLRCGDVVVTGCESRISDAVMAFTNTDVSHCFLMTSPTRGIEGHDGVDDAKLQIVAFADDMPGVHPITIAEELTDASLDRIVVRRPTGDFDRVRLAEAADRYLDRQTPFSGIALALHGMIIAVDGASELRILRIFHGVWDSLLGSFGELLADGTERLVCAELVYRCLWEAGLKIELVEPVHAETIEHLALDHESYDYGDGTTRCDRAWGPLLDEYNRVESDGTLDDIKRATSLIFHHVPAGIADRRTAAGKGDLADMVTPADFLRAEPFTTIFSATRNQGGTWTIDTPS